jgi:hypothetical protein
MTALAYEMLSEDYGFVYDIAGEGHLALLTRDDASGEWLATKGDTTLARAFSHEAAMQQGLAALGFTTPVAVQRADYVTTGSCED